MVKYLGEAWQLDRNKVIFRSLEPHIAMRHRYHGGINAKHRRGNGYDLDTRPIHEGWRTSCWNDPRLSSFAENDYGSRRPT
jgi:hypothetical protein